MMVMVTINLACRCGTRAGLRAQKRYTPSLKIGAAYPESMEAQPPLTCWEPGSTGRGSQSLLGCQADDAETAKVKSWIECRVTPRLVAEAEMTLLHGGSSPAAHRSYSSVGPEAETVAAVVMTTAARTAKTGVTAMHPPHVHSPSTLQGQDGTVGGHRPGHGCHADSGLARRLADT